MNALIMDAPVTLAEVTPQTIAQSIAFTLDGRSIHAYAGETIFKAAQRYGIDIPHLCYKDGLRADGNCRVCVVEIKGERTLAPSCCRSATAGMDVQASSERAVKSQKMVLEILLSDMGDTGYKWNDASSVRPELVEGLAEAPFDGLRAIGNTSSARTVVGQYGLLSHWASRLNVKVRPELRALRRDQPKADMSHPAMAVNLDTCIQCNLCVRACSEVQVNEVIGFAFRGSESKIVFDMDDLMASLSLFAAFSRSAAAASPVAAVAALSRSSTSVRTTFMSVISLSLLVLSMACSQVLVVKIRRDVSPKPV